MTRPDERRDSHDAPAENTSDPHGNTLPFRRNPRRADMTLERINTDPPGSTEDRHQRTLHDPDNTPAHTDDEQDAMVIPLRRQAPDGEVEKWPKTVPDQEVWCYDQKRTRGRDRRFSGRINRVCGAEGDRLRGELTGVICDLLHWAAEQHYPDESTQDGEAA